MTSQDRFPFVLLRFADSSRPGERAGFPILVLHRERSVVVFLPANWESQTEGEYREYLKASLDDWRETPPDRIPDLLLDLKELSTGPLQAVDSGILAPDQLQNLAQQLMANKLPI